MRRQSTHAFSLIELLVVVAIITILVTVVTMKIGGSTDTAAVAATRASIEVMKTNIGRYQLDNGRIPTEAQGLSALSEKPTLEPIPKIYPAGGYQGPVPLDGWKREFVYSVKADGVGYEIISYGKDGEPGGSDVNADISSNDR